MQAICFVNYLPFYHKLEDLPFAIIFIIFSYQND